MDLWIRSQDRTILAKIDNVCVMENRIVFIPSKSNGRATLGTYKTEKRALEVLDEIEERIMLINTIDIAKDTDSLIACKNVLTEEKIKGLNYPYKMPEK